MRVFLILLLLAAPIAATEVDCTIYVRGGEDERPVQDGKSWETAYKRMTQIPLPVDWTGDVLCVASYEFPSTTIWLKTEDGWYGLEWSHEHHAVADYFWEPDLADVPDGYQPPSREDRLLSELELIRKFRDGIRLETGGLS